MKDTYRHKGLRRQLIQKLQEKGIDNQKVLSVMANIPRHFFLDKAFEEWAYEDKAFPIGNEQTISQPFTVAYQTTLLEVKVKDKILEIGTGSGYQATVLDALGANVYTIERQEELFHRTNNLFKKLGIRSIRTLLRDGTKGLVEFAPFNKILVTAGATSLPEALKSQLKIDGILVIPIGDNKTQKMYKITRLSETEFKEEIFDTFRFVPFLKGIHKKE